MRYLKIFKVPLCDKCFVWALGKVVLREFDTHKSHDQGTGLLHHILIVPTARLTCKESFRVSCASGRLPYFTTRPVQDMINGVQYSTV